jgi:sarcosine oxidase
MAARSVGDTRIFRLGHADPVLVDLAMRSESAWAAWGGAFGLRLITPTTTVLSGAPALRWQQAMVEAGAPATLHDSAAGLGLPARQPPGPFLVDHHGGVVDVRGTAAALRAALGPVVRADDRVVGVSSKPLVDASSGVWRCDAVVIAAGAGTPALADSVGIVGVPTQLRHHHRFTFRLASSPTPPCWLDQSGSWRPGYTTYQHRSSSGHWAIGGSLDASDTAWDLDDAEACRRAQEAVRGYLEATCHHAEPEVVDVVHCDSMGLGDGIGVGRSGSVTALWGDNLMKFAPALGSLLAGATQAPGPIDELVRLSARTA